MVNVFSMFRYILDQYKKVLVTLWVPECSSVSGWLAEICLLLVLLSNPSEAKCSVWEGDNFSDPVKPLILQMNYLPCTFLQNGWGYCFCLVTTLTHSSGSMQYSLELLLLQILLLVFTLIKCGFFSIPLLVFLIFANQNPGHSVFSGSIPMIAPPRLPQLTIPFPLGPRGSWCHHLGATCVPCRVGGSVWIFHPLDIRLGDRTMNI